MTAPRYSTGWRAESGRGPGSPARRHRRYPVTLLAILGVVTLAGCSGQDEPTAAEETMTATTTTAPETITPTPSATTPEETATPTASGTTVEETVTCEHRDGYTLAYPADWQTYPDENDPDLGHLACGIFGTAEMELEPETSMPWLPIRVKVEEGVSFEDATRPEARSGNYPSRDVDTQDTTVAGRPAVRVVSVSEAPQDAPPNDFYLPGGTESVYWIVDLSTDTTDRVFIGHAIPPAAAATGVTDADKSAEVATSVDSTAEVLDAMMASLSFTG